MQQTRLGVGLSLLLIAATLGMAEVTARVEDRLRLGVPVFSTPDRERDLVYHDAIAIRGKPNGRYKQWRLNQFGFRNGEMTVAPREGCTRIMALGASETFGLNESPGMEYPAQLAKVLGRDDECYEVINAAIAGLTLRGIIPLWNGWGARFRPDVVMVYPTPAFYLGERSPKSPGPPPATPRAAPPWWSSRMLDRARDRIEYPDIIQHYRVRRGLAAATAAQPPAWFFQNVPADRLAQFRNDLQELVGEIIARGAYPLLLTHATAFHNPPRPDETAALDAWRALGPKPTAQVLLDFEDASRRTALLVSEQMGVAVVDVAGHMNGRREWFADDYLHFNERGAGVVAELIAERISASDIPQVRERHAVQ
jgi:lysophospholipase L1-like esterase